MIITTISCRGSWTWFPTLIRLEYPKETEKLLSCIEDAACGIEEEGTTLGPAMEPKAMADAMRMLRGKAENEAREDCANFSTKASFLYQ